MPQKKKKIGAHIRFRPELFWDVDPKTIDTKKHARYIIERILDFGTDKEIQWMWNHYKKRKQVMRDVVNHSRVLQAQTRPLWRLLLK
ncbi:MAG: hypothetical protein Q7R79_01715 [bacterium]|nr:hypothetical protein [bacterium]